MGLKVRNLLVFASWTFKSTLVTLILSDFGSLFSLASDIVSGVRLCLKGISWSTTILVFMIVISDPVSTNTFSSFVHAFASLSDHDKVTGILNLCPSSFILTLFSEGSDSSSWSSRPRFLFIEREDDEGKTLEELTEKLSTMETS